MFQRSLTFLPFSVKIAIFCFFTPAACDGSNSTSDVNGSSDAENDSSMTDNGDSGMETGIDGGTSDAQNDPWWAAKLALAGGYDCGGCFAFCPQYCPLFDTLLETSTEPALCDDGLVVRSVDGHSGFDRCFSLSPFMQSDNAVIKLDCNSFKEGKNNCNCRIDCSQYSSVYVQCDVFTYVCDPCPTGISEWCKGLPDDFKCGTGENCGEWGVWITRHEPYLQGTTSCIQSGAERKCDDGCCYDYFKQKPGRSKRYGQ
ncbi:MAG: hypothetical protein AAB444_00460 [Patescibacteria group bacterium]